MKSAKVAILRTDPEPPLSKYEGLLKINEVWVKLPNKAQTDRDLKKAFDKARKWVQSRGVEGVGLMTKDWPKDPIKNPCWHLDVEVQAGVAFVGP